MTNCSLDTQDINKNDVAATPQNEISFEQFKNKTGLKNFKNTISLPEVTLNTQAKKVGQNHHTLNDFNIDTTYIKQFIVQNKTTYTFKITPKIVMRNSIFNLNVYNKNGIWETSIIEMIPTDQNHKDLITANTKQFKGKMRLVYQSTPDQNTNNKSYAKSSGTGYTTVFVTGNRHCTRTEECANGTCDNCNQCVDYYAFRLPVDGKVVEALVETTNIESQGGGGSGTNLTDPSGYVIDPNLFDLSNPKSFILLQKAETAAAFWADLSNDLKGWAIVNENEYTTFLNSYLATLTQESRDNSRNLISLRVLYNNVSVSWEQFENWFMGTSEGQDGDYDAAYWGNPNLTFQQQNLPTYNNYVNNMARSQDGKLMEGADNVYGLVGGTVQQARIDNPRRTANTCALKVSIALVRSGIIIPDLPGITLEGSGEFAGKFIFLNAKELNAWMRKTFGTKTGIGNTPINANHLSYNAADGGPNGIYFPNELKNKYGIYSMITTEQYRLDTSTSGHADLLFTDSKGYGNCAFKCFFNLPIQRIDVWILN
ncbi:T6SS effector amidase Tae4 family protein [Flavobacterium sp. K5-23]|uniref:T6SS effector amidase Tae4 family protein n=1 Tax=Flavobacterium sp. K5-23 TaxID=2746225 RepID=UPI00200D43EF|nr:T6SS effector amidase Tae4 family protein [Flavobacterium sp. K5-23]UQD55677.1 hypothetical protein FLAK523_04415 [Flavobacterium sp. K5-23]